MKTKILALAAMTAIALPNLSAAETYFSCGSTATEGSTISLGTITAEGDGIVEVFDYRLGTPGDKLGEATLNAGANSNVRITSTMPIDNDVIAIVTIAGQPAAEKVFDVCED